jgi:hypothetical protein
MMIEYYLKQQQKEKDDYFAKLQKNRFQSLLGMVNCFIKVGDYNSERMMALIEIKAGIEKYLNS